MVTFPGYSWIDVEYHVLDFGAIHNHALIEAHRLRGLGNIIHSRVLNQIRAENLRFHYMMNMVSLDHLRHDVGNNRMINRLVQRHESLYTVYIRQRELARNPPPLGYNDNLLTRIHPRLRYPIMSERNSHMPSLLNRLLNSYTMSDLQALLDTPPQMQRIRSRRNIRLNNNIARSLRTDLTGRIPFGEYQSEIRGGGRGRQLSWLTRQSDLLGGGRAVGRGGLGRSMWLGREPTNLSRIVPARRDQIDRDVLDMLDEEDDDDELLDEEDD